MKTRLALTAYYAAIGILALFTAVVVIKLLFWPPCVPTNSSCSVDGWSIAGLAATILGVSATVLAILGTVTVAGWWTVLDKRVNDQVSSLFSEQKIQLNTRVDSLIAEQEKKVGEQLHTFQTQFEGLKEPIGELNKGVTELHSFADNVIELALDVAMVNPPWEIDRWALTTMNKYRIPDIAKGMVFNYLGYIDSLLSPNPSVSTRFTARLAQQNAPMSPLYYWEGALRWQKVVDEYDPNVSLGNALLEDPSLRISEIQKEVRDKIEMYRSKIELWKKQQGQ